MPWSFIAGFFSRRRWYSFSSAQNVQFGRPLRPGSCRKTPPMLEMPHLQDPMLNPFLKDLAALLGAMDRGYAEVAAQYGFVCRGCVENCCLTRFHHHTYAEYFYLRQGFFSLDPDRRAAVLQRAHSVCRCYAEADAQQRTVRVMCPLNEAGFCMLYDRRPMICRLHGLPHELQKPAPGGKIYGSGCVAFEQRFGKAVYIPFDRTVFYRKMAALENALKKATGLVGKLKMTVAEMIVQFNEAY